MINVLILAALIVLVVLVGLVGFTLLKLKVAAEVIAQTLVKLNSNTVEAGVTIARNTAKCIPLNRL